MSLLDAAEVTPAHAVAHFLRAQGLHVVDGVWPGDEIPAECLEVDSKRLLVITVDVAWANVEAIQLGCPKRWADCFGAIAIELETGTLRVCSRGRKGWHQIRTLDGRGMPQLAIVAPVASWHPISSLVNYLHGQRKKTTNAR